MRRQTTVPFVVILGLVAALGGNPTLLAAQEGDPPPIGENISYTMLGEVTRERADLQRFDFTFSATQAVILSESPDTPFEPMIVVVEAGYFCFEVYGENASAIVDPPLNEAGIGVPIRVLATEGDECTDQGTETTFPPDEEPCLEDCVIPAGIPVGLGPGAAVYFPGGFCLWCLLNDAPGTLQVYALLVPDQPFTWTALVDNAPQGTPTASGGIRALPASLPVNAFNPPSHCH